MREAMMSVCVAAIVAASGSANAQVAPTMAVAQTPALPLRPEERLRFDTSEATWMALDVSPDGRTILFDLLGDIYAMDVGGGPARPILTGQSFDTQPVFSPDGKRIAFLSDRSGANNLWVMNADGSDPRRLSADTEPAIYTSPAWSHDSRFVYVSRTIHTLLAFELFTYDADGGSGIKLTQARPQGNERGDDRNNVLGAVASPDGRYLYYARKTGAFWSERPLPHWEIARRDVATGVEDRIIAAPGAAMRPALSHDGKTLVYASRYGKQTGLRVRDLVSGRDRWLTYPIDTDSQKGGYYNDLVPRVAFLPDDTAVLTAIGGKVTRVALADGARTPVPFTAHVDLPLGRNTRVEVSDETGPVRVRVIQAPRLSPDSRRVAFAALGTLYIQPRAGSGRPTAVAGVSGMAYQPAWTPDGRNLVYVTWSALDGGQLWTVPAGGGRPRRLLSEPAFYTEPVVSPDGRSVAVLRASQIERLNSASDLSPNRPTDIVVVPIAGGSARLVAQKSGARSLSFDTGGTRLRYMTGDGIESVGLSDGASRRDVDLRVANSNRYFANMLVPPEDARLSPDGTRLLVKAASQLYLVDMPPPFGGNPQRVELPKPSVAASKLTNVGADYIDWSADGRTILWSVGAAIRSLDAATAARLPKGGAEASAASTTATIERPRDVPRGTIVLRGGRAITMRGDEVIDGADVVVTDNRIVAVGRTGSVTVPDGATIHNATGKWIVPGFVDTHAHYFELRRQVFDLNHWDMLANLAYGVTSGLEVQPFTVDVFGYQDMIDAGMMIGPRAFSTGPGVFVNSEIDSLADARAVLSRYRDHYRTRNIKAYLVGNRAQRQYLVQAAEELGMMPTTEGASDLNLNLSHALDGFAGNEHNLPISPLRSDIVTLLAKSRISYTPTFNVLYGGFAPIDDMIIADADGDEKLRRFVPPGIVEARLRNRTWTPPFDRTADSFAADALKVRRAGGLVGIGSHGVIQGLAYHYEMQAYALGGATPFEILRAATIESAEVIGRAAQIGSLEPGKYADLLILSADPLTDIRNTRTIDYVMKNGRLYAGASLDETWPRRRSLPPQWFAADAPAGVGDAPH